MSSLTSEFNFKRQQRTQSRSQIISVALLYRLKSILDLHKRRGGLTSSVQGSHNQMRSGSQFNFVDWVNFKPSCPAQTSTTSTNFCRSSSRAVSIPDSEAVFYQPMCKASRQSSKATSRAVKSLN